MISWKVYASNFNDNVWEHRDEFKTKRGRKK